MCGVTRGSWYGPRGMQLAPGSLQTGVDLDGVDAVRALGERQRDVVAVPRADDQHVARWAIQMRVRPRVERGADLVEREHRLVRERVHADRDPSACVGAVDRDPVVRRPDVVWRKGPERQHDRDPRHRGRAAHEAPGRRQREEGDRQQHAPHDRTEPQERQRREHDDAQQAPRDVQAVGLERLEPLEQPSHALGDVRHHPDRPEEQHGQRDPDRRRGQPERALEPGGVAEILHDPHDEHERGEDRERGRRPPEPVPLAARPQEPDADPEEARQQHEVREVRDVHLIRRDPADQRQLGEEHDPTREHQPWTVTGPGPRHGGR